MQDSLLKSADKLIAEGNRAEDAGNLREACERYREAARIAPRYAKAHLNLGIGLEAMGDAEGAIGSHQEALACDPAEPFASYNLGRLLFLRDDPAGAERLLRQALHGRPGFPEAHVVLARVLASLGRLEEAGAALEQVTRLADARAAGGDLSGAAAALEALLALRPDWADALYNYGCILKRLRRTGEAEAALRRALAADPGHAAACRMLGGVLREQCRTQEALELFRAARERHVEDFELASAELYALIGDDRVPDGELFSRHAAFGAALERAYPARFRLSNAPDPERRLRIGYLSPDFRYHVVTLFMLPVMERRDRLGAEVYCYSTGDGPDDHTRKLAGLADAWRDCSGASETELAERIHADGIDILVDLAGHSGLPQLRVFAQRPAPVQATWLGYLGTTGMTRMHYRISDPVADPPGMTERLHTEALVRLPHSQWCYRPFVQVEAVRTPPCLKNGYVTFGSFNQAAKISPSTRLSWARILALLPDARLVVAGVPPGRAQQDLRRDFAAAGVAADRLALLPYVSLQDYFGLFGTVDIALDTQPYSGGTTTCDALWMGVPVISAPGTRPASRSAASILASVGLHDWIAPSAEEYVRRAVAFAGAPDRLAGLRASLRGQMRASPLMDERGFVRALEGLYRSMWRRWCAAPR
jgi:predicted O-linked N-acetylglucosamine transferase (SPINDLY family)